MQGVENLGDYAVQIRAKMMIVPGEQFVIRRKAYEMIKKAFDKYGIKFAFPTVQVAGEGEAATAAVVHAPHAGANPIPGSSLKRPIEDGNRMSSSAVHGLPAHGLQAFRAVFAAGGRYS
jgi:hypothetical protein